MKEKTYYGVLGIVILLMLMSPFFVAIWVYETNHSKENSMIDMDAIYRSEFPEIIEIIYADDHYIRDVFDLILYNNEYLVECDNSEGKSCIFFHIEKNGDLFEKYFEIRSLDIRKDNEIKTVNNYDVIDGSPAKAFWITPDSKFSRYRDTSSDYFIFIIPSGK